MIKTLVLLGILTPSLSSVALFRIPKAKVQSEDEYFEEELKKYNKKHKEKKK